ncbi:hypothetical protein BD626DRAFT_566023 [Schizophyllum amplum]|uniref:Fungal-type protein kinase domain-containing protein n=1 Tax=Schizophyllum amplum TaxID=97359 RepID=A0A550CQ90_9AGAR|nr:hypothetical protein BD626DRAFT_566023 [Auriculariopsis ampla]
MSHHPVSESSPYKPTAVSQNPVYKKGKMKKNRDLFAEDIGSVPQIPVADFLAHFMPPLKLDKEDLQTVFKKLCTKWRPYGGVSSDTIVEKETRSKAWQTAFAPYDKKHGVWSDYACEPKDRPGEEKVVYEDLDDICEQVVACCKEVKVDLKQTTRLISNGKKTLRGSKSNPAPPDALHLLLDERGNVALEVYDCVCNSEFKKTSTRELDLDNSKKTIWDMHHVMRTDPRRRFTTGMSFSNTKVRLWHYNREVIVVSEPWDLNQDSLLLIEVYARLSFATMTELGYDPTVVMLPLASRGAKKSADDKVDPQFRIRVRDSYYITVKTRADYGPEDGCGRCTRIFSVYKEGGDPSKTLIIKDCWIEASRDTEFDILREIRTDILAFDWQACCQPVPSRKEDLQPDKPIDLRYELTKEQRAAYFIPIIDGVKVMVDDRQDDTQHVIARGYQFADKRDMFPLVDLEPLPVDDTEGKGHTRHISTWHGTIGAEAQLTQPEELAGRFFRPIVPRAHHRLVMEEGTTLSAIEDAKTAFEIAADAAYALFVLHCVRWLHRDISAENIYKMADGKGVLADLEYSKRATDERTRSFRTGTPDFIAIEVAMQRYLRGQPDPDDGKPIDCVFGTDHDITKSEAVVWRFRDLHDLESIWWLCLWLLFRHTTDLPTSSPYDLIHHSEECASIFPGTLAVPPQRLAVLEKRSALDKSLDALPPAWKDAMQAELQFVRWLLYDAYKPESVGKVLDQGFWWRVQRVCQAGQAIEGRLRRISRAQIEQLKEKAQAAKAAPVVAKGHGTGSQLDAQEDSSSGDIDMVDASHAVQPLQLQAETVAKSNKRKLRDSGDADDDFVLGLNPHGQTAGQSTKRRKAGPSGSKKTTKRGAKRR